MAAQYLIESFDTSQRRVAQVLGLHRSTQRYKEHPREEEHLIRRMKELTANHRRFGLPRIYYLLRREGAVKSRSRAQRVYRKLGLQIKNRVNRRPTPHYLDKSA